MENQFVLNEMLAKDCIDIHMLPLCKVLMMNDSQYPWFVLVPKVNNIKDIYELDWEQQIQFLNESSMLSEVLMELFKGIKLNVAAIGNICPQLHIHHIVRFENDIAWPKPVWGAFPVIPYSDEALLAVKTKVKNALLAITAN